MTQLYNFQLTSSKFTKPILQNMAETCPNFDIFCIFKHLRLFWKLWFINHFYFELSSIQCILGAPVYIMMLKQTLLVIDVVLVHKIQLLPSGFNFRIRFIAL